MANKRRKKTGARSKTGLAPQRGPTMLSVTVNNLFNMGVTVATSGVILLFLFAAKRVT